MINQYYFGCILNYLLSHVFLFKIIFLCHDDNTQIFWSAVSSISRWTDLSHASSSCQLNTNMRKQVRSTLTRHPNAVTQKPLIINTWCNSHMTNLYPQQPMTRHHVYVPWCPSSLTPPTHSPAAKYNINIPYICSLFKHFRNWIKTIYWNI